MYNMRVRVTLILLFFLATIGHSQTISNGYYNSPINNSYIYIYI